MIKIDTFNLHDQRKQYQHHFDTEVLPFLASCIQILDSVKYSYYTRVDAMQLPAKGSHPGLLYVDLPLANHTELLQLRTIRINSWIENSDISIGIYILALHSNLKKLDMSGFIVMSFSYQCYCNRHMLPT